METWQINLSLIPSIAVILASANRTALGLTEELNVRLIQNSDSFGEIIPLKIRQLKRLSLATFLMYVSLIILIANALLTALDILKPEKDKYLILLAVFVFFIGVTFMLLFSWNAYFIRQKQFKVFLKKVLDK